MQKIFFKKKFLFILLLVMFFNIQNAFSYQNRFTEDYYRDYYATDYSYNIFSADTWNISPHVFVGYSYGWVPYFNRIEGNCCKIEYGDMLRNGHNGFIIGSGITINKNWMIGMSFQKMKRSSTLREYETQYPEISSIKSDLFLMNLDLALRLPFSFFENRFNFYTVAGFNIVTANLGNNYNQGTATVPVELTSVTHKVAFGTNIGFSVSYRIISGLYVKAECRRMFILTRRTSLVSDSWLMNIAVGMNF